MFRSFSAVGHCSCEVVGSYVCKRGDRLAAPQPAAQGLAKHFGSITADDARRLTLRIACYHALVNHALPRLRWPLLVQSS
jgi:hypothetical protein